MPIFRKRLTTPSTEVDEIAGAEADALDQRREDSRSGDSQSGIEGIELGLPEGVDPADYLLSVDRLQAELIAAGGELENIRIVQATLPTETAPKTHKGPHAGFPVATGEVFTVKTNKGHVLTVGA